MKKMTRTNHYRLGQILWDIGADLGQVYELLDQCRLKTPKNRLQKVSEALNVFRVTMMELAEKEYPDTDLYSLEPDGEDLAEFLIESDPANELPI